MPLDKPVFNSFNAHLNALSTLEFRPSSKEEEAAKNQPRESKGNSFLRGITFGATDNLRRGRRAKREGLAGSAYGEYLKAAAKSVIVVPLAPLGLLAGSCVDGSQSGHKSRTPVGIREDALVGRLETLANILAGLSGQHSHYMAGAATAQDLVEVSQAVTLTLSRLEASLKVRGIARLRVSPLLQKAFADVRRAQRSFDVFVDKYSGHLRQWATLCPDLVDHRLLGVVPPQSSVAEKQAASADLGQLSVPPCENDAILSLQTEDGTRIVDLPVATSTLCKRSDYFESFYSGPLSDVGARSQARLVVPDPDIAKFAVLAIMTDKAPAFTTRDFLPMHALFDMWGCESMLTYWRSGIDAYLSKVGVEGAMQSAAAQSPGSSLAMELFEGAWDNFLPLKQHHFEQAGPNDGVFLQAQGSESWAQLEKNEQTLHCDIRWRTQQRLASKGNCGMSPRYENNNFEFALHLENNRHGALDDFDLHIHLFRGPPQPVNITDLASLSTGWVQGIQMVHFVGDANGMTFDKQLEIRRNIDKDGLLNLAICANSRLCTLGAQGLKDDQDSPLFIDGHMKLRMRVDISGMFLPQNR